MKPITLLSILLLFTPLLQAQTAEEKGLAIAVEADKRNQGWKDQATRSKMILRNKQGEESLRQMHGKALEVMNDGDKTLIVFDSPRDVKGTAFLSYTHIMKPDDQWLYLPALKRVKRISSSSKSGPFMGSEFSYEDISSQEVPKYRYRYIRDDVIDARPVFVVERFPQYRRSGYTKMVTFIDKAMYQPLKIDYYDRKKRLLKTLTQHDFKQYLGKYWRPSRMEMVNHQNGKSTSLIWESYKFNNGFTDRDFDRSSLKRAR